MNEPTVRQVASKTLYGRVSSYCRDKGIHLLRYVFSDIYSCEITHKLKHEVIVKLGTNGLIDSIRGLLTNYDTVKLEMYINDIYVCEFAILKFFAQLKFAILVLPKVNFVFPTNSVLLLLFLIGYIS